MAGPSLDIHPAEFDGLDIGDQVAVDEQNAEALGSEQPFMGGGGEGVDTGFLDVDGKGSEALDGVDDEQAIMAAADCAYPHRGQCESR